MNVKQLKEILEQFDDYASICVYFKWAGDSVLDEAVWISNNKGSVQINCLTILDEDCECINTDMGGKCTDCLKGPRKESY